MATKSSFSIWHVLPVLIAGGASFASYVFFTEWVESKAVIWVTVVCLVLGLVAGQISEKVGKYDSPLFSVYLPAGACVVFLIIQLLST